MIKFTSRIFILILLVQIAVIAQDPVKISGGRLSVFGGDMSSIQTALFSATSEIPEDSESVWYHVCHPGSTQAPCAGGATFKLPYSTRIGLNIGTALPFETGNITIGEQTYQNVFYSGRLFFADDVVSPKLFVAIPKVFNQRRKGTYRITIPFELNSNSTFRVCRVSMLNAPCPGDQLLFDGKLTGKGTVVVTLKFNNQNPEAVTNYDRLIRKTFEYRFEPFN